MLAIGLVVGVGIGIGVSVVGAGFIATCGSSLLQIAPYLGSALTAAQIYVLVKESLPMESGKCL